MRLVFITFVCNLSMWIIVQNVVSQEKHFLVNGVVNWQYNTKYSLLNDGKESSDKKDCISQYDSDCPLRTEVKHFSKNPVLYWQDNHFNEETLDWYSATKQCERLKIHFLDNFRLPTVDEVGSLPKKYRFTYESSFPGALMLTSDKCSPYKSKRKKRKKRRTSNGKISALAPGGGDIERARCFEKERSLSFHCVTEFDAQKFNVHEYAMTKMSEDLSQASKFILPKPQRPTQETSIDLIKDEFETTSDFNKRKNEEILKLKTENNDKFIKWQAQVKTWEKAKNEHNQKNDQLINKKNSIYLSYIEEGISIKYGKPIIRNAIYNADNQYFDIDLISERGGFAKKIRVPIAIRSAREFKTILLAKNFSPIVEFDITYNQMAIAGIKQIKDPEMMVIEDLYNKSFDSISDLKLFIKKYHSVPSYFARAKARITYLQEKDKNERLESIRVAERKRLESEKENKERMAKIKQDKLVRDKYEREFNYLGTCKLGDTVYHREKWNTKTSSGNIVADYIFDASVKEQFIIEFEGTVTGFVGNKVEVHINDFAVKQTRGGGFFEIKTSRGKAMVEYAEKRLGKSFFYDKYRCK